MTNFIENKKAYYNYKIIDKLECGIVLLGNEVKSIRNGTVSIREAYASIKNNELILHNMHINKFDKANAFDVDEHRDKKLLIHKRELIRLKQAIKEKGLTLIPLNIHMVGSKYKVCLGICQGKHNYDKRQSIKEKDIKRQIKHKTM